MVNYYFYKLVCNDLNVKHTYVGSTVNFTRRKSAHKCDSIKPTKIHQKIYSCMAENGGFDNWQMVLLEQRFFETKLEAHRHERWFFEQLNSKFAMNTKYPQRDKAEYRLDNKENIAAYKKDYNEANKDAIAAQKKDYNEANKAAIDAYKIDYRETNKDAIAAQKKDYNEANKDAIAARCKVKFNCSCGGRYTRHGLQQHMKTNKHTAYIAQIKK